MMNKAAFQRRWYSSIFCLIVLLLPNSTKVWAQRAELPLDLTNLEQDTTQWNMFQDGGSVMGMISSSSALGGDGNVLKATLSGGDAYAGMHVYRNLPFVGGGTQFTLSLAFYFTNSSAVQALEFTMNSWQSNQRWEWAMQWEHLGDGGPQQGSPPTWRIWTGTGWQDTGITQDLSALSWHTFQLYGTIIAGNVHYEGFSCDDTSSTLGQTFAFIFSQGEKLAVGVQLDGNSQEEPYDLYLNQVNFSVS